MGQRTRSFLVIAGTVAVVGVAVAGVVGLIFRLLWPPIDERGLALTIPAHGSLVTRVAFSPDGETIASVGRDGSVRLWDSAGGEKLALLVPTTLVRDLCFSPDGRRLAATSGNSILVWRLSGGEPLVLDGHKGEVLCLAFHPGGKLLVSGAMKQEATGSGGALLFAGDIRLWNLATGAEIRQFDLPGQPRALCFSRDGRRLAIGANSELSLYDSESGKLLWSRGVPMIQVLRFHPDGSRLVAGYRTSGSAGFSSVGCFDLATGEPTGDPIDGTRPEVHALELVRDGSLLFTVGQRPRGGLNPRGWSVVGVYRIWDLKQGRERLAGGAGSRLSCAAIAPDGRRFVTGHENGLLRLWDVPADW